MWAVTFSQDTDQPGLGTVVASNGEFSFDRRVDTNSSEDVDAFVSEAKEKHLVISEAITAKASVKASIESVIAGKLEA